ncbi:MAG: triose-phosphate isomerase [Spirochaetota bacterium]|jgi:triosephosphate isomerase|nr:triose-phosphate isomerase [Spirochaetota bacterium]
MRKPFLAGNWKMNKTAAEAQGLVKELLALLADTQDRDVAICPAFPCLAAVAQLIQGSKLRLGAQNMYFEDSGAYTGEVSADMLLAVGAEYVILGHSERRAYFGENNEIVNKKLKKALAKGLGPIVCVGEVLEEREAGKAEFVVEDHVRGAFAGISEAEAARVTIAYEPVWAIGTGKTATPNDADSMHAHIRKVLSALYSPALAENLRIQYGGSVNDKNIDELMRMPNIDGALVGGASLKAESFARIVKFIP